MRLNCVSKKIVGTLLLIALCVVSFVPKNIYATEWDTPKNYMNRFPYMGDANRNGDVTAYDALLILQNCVKICSIYEDIDPELSDVDQDGHVTAEDALGILHIVVGLEPLVEIVPDEYDTVEIEFYETSIDNIERRTGRYWQVIDSVEEMQEFMDTVFVEYTAPQEYLQHIDRAKEYVNTLDEAFFEENVFVVTMNDFYSCPTYFYYKDMTDIVGETEGEVFGKLLTMGYKESKSDTAMGVVFTGTIIPRADLEGREIAEVVFTKMAWNE